MNWKDVQELRKQGNISEGKKLAYDLLEIDDRASGLGQCWNG